MIRFVGVSEAGAQASGKASKVHRKWMVLFACSVLTGCLAQQADLKKVEGELGAKLKTLDQQEKELQSSLAKARGDLDKLITDTRARLREEISNIREQEIPKLQGKQDELDHRAGELRNKLDDVRSGMTAAQKRLEAIERIQHDQTQVIKADRDRAQADREQARAELGTLTEALKKLGQAVDERLAVQEKSLAAGQSKAVEGLAQRLDAQGKEFTGSLGEFRVALEKFKAVMVELESRVGKADERAHQVESRTKELAAVVERDEKATTRHLAEVNKSMGSITKTVETLGDKLSARDQEQDRRLEDLNKYVASIVKTVESVGDKLALRMQEQDQRLDEFGKGLSSMQDRVAGLVRDRDAAAARSSDPTVAPSGRAEVPGGRAVKGQSVDVTGAAGTAEPSGAGSRGPDAAMAMTPPLVQEAAGRASGKEMYEDVYQKFKQGKLDQARQGFTDFLVLYPSSELAPNAQYWLGECFYGKKDFKRAIDAFLRVRTAYPASDKVPAAMLKEGFAYLALKDNKNASTLLKQVVHSYPKSTEAGKASEKLAQLRVAP